MPALTMSEPLSRPSTQLAAYMNYVSEEGIDLDRFVEHGGRLLGKEDHASLSADLTGLELKLDLVKEEHPRLARQLAFLRDLFQHRPTTLPASVRNETIFALLYAVKDMDLIPDDIPGIGFTDDAAVVEVVLSRHASFFTSYCQREDIEWDLLKPELNT